MSGNRFVVPDSVNFENFSRIRDLGREYLDTASAPVTIDLSQVVLSISVLSVLLTDWERYANSLDIDLAYMGVNKGLTNLVAVFGMENVLRFGQ